MAGRPSARDASRRTCGSSASIRFRHSGAREARTRNPFLQCKCGPMDSGLAPSGAPRNDKLLGDPRLLRVGGFPHHAFAALAAEQLDRVVIVDVAELPLVDAVAAHL